MDKVQLKDAIEWRLQFIADQLEAELRRVRSAQASFMNDHAYGVSVHTSGILQEQFCSRSTAREAAELARRWAESEGAVAAE